MRQFILPFIILFGTFYSISQTSIYHPFPDSDAVWNFHYHAYCFYNGDGDDNYSIVMTGDTLINGENYHQLKTPFIESYSTGNCGYNQIGYRGAIREDVVEKKVYYVPPASTSEELLYDFNLEVGDTVKGYINTSLMPDDVDVVLSIDSVLVGSTYRKRWNINNCYGISIIEGVGSTYGLFMPSPGCTPDQASFSLTCLQQNGQPLYPDTLSVCEPILQKRTIDHFNYSDSRWYVADSYADADIEHPSFVSTKTTIYGYKGDSIINGERWWKIYATEDKFFQNNLKYLGLTRSEDGGVFYLDTLNQLDTLYNFNLEVGDSAYFKLNGTPQWINVVDVDSVLLDDGAYYKRIKFDEPQDLSFFSDLNEVWIEDVGSIHGPLFTNAPHKFSNEIPDSLILTCSFSNNRYVWKHPSYANCYIRNVLSIQELENEAYKVYPNPFSDEIHIEKPGVNEIQLTITNSIGKVVHKLEIDNAQTTIDLSTLDAGIYILKMQNESYTSTLKIIKER